MFAPARFLHALTTATVLAALCGCGRDLLFIEAQSTTLCQHLAAQRLTVPAGLSPGAPLTVGKDFTFTLPADVSRTLSGAGTSVRLRSVELTAAEGEDFAFIDAARLTLIAPAGSGLPDYVAVEYRRTEPRPTRVRLEGPSVDVARYFETSALRLVTALEGTAPRGDVVVGLDACAEVSLRLEYAR